MRDQSYSIFTRVKARKKGNLSLSINAIVILVLAIAMLGLGLSFTKSMFKKFGEKLSIPPPPVEPDATDPIALPNDELSFRHGEEFTFQVNFFNDYAGGTVDPGIECHGPEALKKRIFSYAFSGNAAATATPGASPSPAVSGAGIEDFVKTAPQYVESGEHKAFKFIIPKGATQGVKNVLDVCSVKFCAPTDSDEGNFDKDDSGKCETKNEEVKQITIKVS